MKTLDEMVVSGMARLQEKMHRKHELDLERQKKQDLKRIDFWTAVQTEVEGMCPVELVKAMFDFAFIDRPLDPRPKFEINLPGMAPFIVELSIYDEGRSVQIAHDFKVASVVRLLPAIEEFEDDFEGYVDWGFEKATEIGDIEMALALASMRFVDFKDCEAENKKIYQDLLDKKAKKTKVKEAEYVPVDDGEDVSPLDGMSQALRTLVFSLVDERLEIRH
jgi:hypothetical protein